MSNSESHPPEVPSWLRYAVGLVALVFGGATLLLLTLATFMGLSRGTLGQGFSSGEVLKSIAAVVFLLLVFFIGVFLVTTGYRLLRNRPARDSSTLLTARGWRITGWCLTVFGSVAAVAVVVKGSWGHLPELVPIVAFAIGCFRLARRSETVTLRP